MFGSFGALGQLWLEFISLSGGIKYRFYALGHLSHFACVFPKSIVSDQDRRGYWERIIVLLKPQYEQGAHRCGWKYGLIEVDLMPTLAKERLHS